MKNIHPLNGNRQGRRVKTARGSKTNVFAKAGIFALLLATGCLLFLSGCRNVLQAPGTGLGTLSLTIDREGVERTILPDIELGVFASFELEFTQHHTGNIVTESWTPASIAGGSGRVELSAGTWDLHVSAFKENVGEPMAEGQLWDIVVPAGGIVAGNVMLSPVGSGTGTFSWDLSFPDNTNHARMRIDRVYPWGGSSYWETFYFVDYWWGNPITSTQHSTPLPVGQYRVVFILHHSQWGEMGLSAILHIYQDMESHFYYEFTDEYFPLPVLNSILAAWDGTSWNFAERGIEVGHFSIVGIYGINDGNFSDIVYWFNAFVRRRYDEYGWRPTCCCDLRTLTDAALIGIASTDANFLNANNYGHRAAAEIAIAELVRNDRTPWFSWADYRTVNVHISPYTVQFTFSADIGMPPEPQPGDSLADWLAWLRFFAQSGGTYNIVIGGNESISPLQAALPNVWGLTINLSGSVPSTVSLASNGSLFALDHNVNLVLGNNITLQGMDGNNAPLVRVHSGSTLVMDAGAEITGNTNTYVNWSGGGVLVSGGTFTMNAGLISNNSVSGNGGGVFVDWGTFNMRGGTIYGNTASSNGGGVFVGWSGTLNIYNGIIHGINAVAGLRNLANNGAALFNNGTARHGIFYNDYGFYTLGYLNTMGLTIEVIDGVFQMPQRAGGVAAQLLWLRYFAEDAAYTIEVIEDEDVVPQSLSFDGRDITITLSGIGQRTINLASYGSLFTVGYGVTLVLDNNITLQGRDGNTSVLVRVDHGGTLVMNEGARIVDNANTNTSCCCNRGGGVHVNDGGTFNMYGGVISGNMSNNGWNPDAGGVLNFGVFNMRGGVISGNASTWGSWRGGGVHNSGNFFMSNGVIYGIDAPEDLRNTVAEWWYGAALHDWGIAQYGTFSNGNFYWAGDLYTTNYTIRVVNGIRPPGDLTISIADFQEIGTYIPSDLTVSILQGTSATVTVLDPGQFDSITWFFGTNYITCCCWGVSGSHNETITINSNTSGNRLGRHSVTVEVRMGGVLYSKRIAFRVVP